MRAKRSGKSVGGNPVAGSNHGNQHGLLKNHNISQSTPNQPHATPPSTGEKDKELQESLAVDDDD
eukprot:1358015-Amphidinium_carterae.1